MHLTRRHVLFSAVVLGTRLPIPASTSGPKPPTSAPAPVGSGIAALAVRTAPADWWGVFPGGAARRGAGHALDRHGA